MRPLVRLSVTVIAEHNGRREIGTAGGGGRTGLEMFDDATLDAYVDQGVKDSAPGLQAA